MSYSYIHLPKEEILIKVKDFTLICIKMSLRFRGVMYCLMWIFVLQLSMSKRLFFKPYSRLFLCIKIRLDFLSFRLGLFEI